MCHSREPRTPCVPFQLKLFTQGGHSSKGLEFLQVPQTLPFSGPSRGRPRGPCYPIINRKFTYTPSTAIALGGISRELENRVFLWVLRMAGQSEAII